jgi:hypothetical protein
VTRGRRDWRVCSLSRLGSRAFQIVGGEHHRRFERCDRQAEARPEAAGIGVGLLNRVVKHADGDHVVWRPGVVEQAADLERCKMNGVPSA